MILLVMVGMAGAFYLGLRLVRAFEKWVDYYGSRKETVWPPSQAPSTPSPVSQVAPLPARVPESRVPELVPEAVLRRAPKSAGFGHASHGDQPPGAGTGGQAGGDPPPADCPPGKL